MKVRKERGVDEAALRQPTEKVRDECRQRILQCRRWPAAHELNGPSAFDSFIEGKRRKCHGAQLERSRTHAPKAKGATVHRWQFELLVAPAKARKHLAKLSDTDLRTKVEAQLIP